MSINTIMNYKKIKQRKDRTVIAPCNPKDIKYCSIRNEYAVNYLVKIDNRCKAITLFFHSYEQAYIQMNIARKLQGFKKLPTFKTYKG